MRHYVLLTILSLLVQLSMPACTRSKRSPSDDVTKSEESVLNNSLLRAVMKRDLSAVKEAVGAGAQVNAEFPLPATDQKLTPLLAAIAVEDREIALYLLSVGARDTVEFQGYDANDFSNWLFGKESELTIRLNGLSISKH